MRKVLAAGRAGGYDRVFEVSRMRTWRIARGLGVMMLVGSTAACSTVVEYFPPWGPPAEQRSETRTPARATGAEAPVEPAQLPGPGTAAPDEEEMLAGEREEIVFGPRPEPLTEAEQRQLDRNLKLAGTFRDRDLEAYASREAVVVTLPDLMFEFGSAELTDQARREVRDIAEVLLREGRGRRIEVGGHTDAIGAELYNVGLSERRAKAVRDALVAENVSEALVEAVGYGSAKPIAPNSFPDGSDNPAGRARNRRVEIVVLN